MLLTPWLGAQGGGVVVKKKVLNPEQFQRMTEGATTQTALSGEALDNGDFVSLRRKNQEGRLNGVFVYEDTKNQKIYVRPRPNEAPVAIPVKEIEDMERIVPASTQGAKGGVRFANEDQLGARHREIQALSIYNGPNKEVRYYAPTLSNAEKQELQAMARAANDVASGQDTVASLERSMGDQPGTYEEAVSREILARQKMIMALASVSAPPMMPIYTYNFPYESFSYLPTYNYGGNIIWGGGLGMPNLGAYGLGLGASFGAGVQSIQSVTVAAPQPARPQDLPELQKSLQSAREKLDRDRQAYATARSRAIVDDRGDIVAVRLDEK
jgi:hypothetical protein